MPFNVSRMDGAVDDADADAAAGGVACATAALASLRAFFVLDAFTSGSESADRFFDDAFLLLLLLALVLAFVSSFVLVFFVDADFLVLLAAFFVVADFFFLLLASLALAFLVAGSDSFFVVFFLLSAFVFLVDATGDDGAFRFALFDVCVFGCSSMSLAGLAVTREERRVEAESAPATAASVVSLFFFLGGMLNES